MSAAFARRAAAAWALTLALCAPGAAPAQEDGRKGELKALERALEKDRSEAEALARKGEILEQEIRILQAESIAIARAAQDGEARLSAIEAQLADLEGKAAAAHAGLRARRVQLGHTLAALQRIALAPPDALLAAPGSPVDTVRGAMLLRAAVPAIERRAEHLRADLDDLTALRRKIAVQRAELAEATAALETDRARLRGLIERKRAARALTEKERAAARERAARLAGQAKDLRDLVARVEREATARAAREAAEREAAEREAAEREAAERRAAEGSKARDRDGGAAAAPEAVPPPGPQVALAQPDNIRPFPQAGASLVMPARGRVVRRFGQGGGGAKGIAITARRGAQVVAPFDGKVVYAGIFRSYGQILIIEHGGRYHTLLAGLERTDAVVGQWVLAGEPVGVLGSPRNGDPELYLELRHAGQPINPLPWLARTGDKVQG